MSRSTDDAPLTTKAARERLPQRDKPYWRAIEGGLAVGYRRGARGGTWLVRRVLPGGRYSQGQIGRADDTLTADGQTVLDFKQASKAAAAWAERAIRVAEGLEPEPNATPAKPYTVADALDAYLAELAGRGSKGLADTRTAAEAHVRPALGAIPVPKLTRDKVRGWHRALAAAPARVRGKRGETRVRQVDPADEDAPRRRQATANRILTVLKAALNFAREDGKVACPDDAWALVKPFKEADAPKVRWLTDDEAVRLANASGGDFRALVTAAMLTGCRYGELAALRVVNLHLAAGVLDVPKTKGGKARTVVLTTEAVAFFTRQAAGRKPSDRVFERDATVRQGTRDKPAVTRRAPWGKSDQFRHMKEACAAAGIVPAVSFHVLRHTHGSRLAMKAVPLQVVAKQLGHADTRMTERHYAHLAPNYVADTVRAAFADMGLVQLDNVTPIHRKA